MVERSLLPMNMTLVHALELGKHVRYDEAAHRLPDFDSMAGLWRERGLQRVRHQHEDIVWSNIQRFLGTAAFWQHVHSIAVGFNIKFMVGVVSLTLISRHRYFRGVLNWLSALIASYMVLAEHPASTYIRQSTRCIHFMWHSRALSSIGTSATQHKFGLHSYEYIVYV